VIRLELSEAADADLVEILRYGVEVFGEESGEAYVHGFGRSFDLIRQHPFAGAIHAELRPPIRSLSYGSHRIFYDVREDDVVVRRILHKSMDVERHL
jgi:toxin ParE1/3/4